MKIKWVFRYANYLILIPAVCAIGYFKLPYWYNPLFLLLALISEIVITRRKSKVEKLINTAQNLKRLSDSFSIFVYSNLDNSIPSIFKALLANDIFTKKYGKGIKGWKLYLEDQTKNLYHEYSEFTTALERYIENPKGKIELSDIIMRFEKLVGLHYKLHLNFLEIIKDTYDILPEELGQRYREFKKEYDDFYSNLRVYTSDLKDIAPMDTEKYFFDRAKELPKGIIKTGES